MSDYMLQLAKKLCLATGTPRAQMVYMLLQAGEYQQIAELTIDPHNYNTAYSFQLDYQVTEFLRKYPDLPVNMEGYDNIQDYRADSAVRGFYENLSTYWSKQIDLETSNEEEWYDDVRREISEIVKGFKHIDVIPRHGPGATLSHRGREATAFHKFDGIVSGSKRVIETLGIPVDSSEIDYTDYTVARWVPKTALSLRNISFSPSIDMMYQLALNDALAELYEINVGYSIKANDWKILATEHHKTLAIKGSADGSVATIDLKNGSDNVLIYHVDTFFKHEPELYWFMNLVRTRRIHVEDRIMNSPVFAPQGAGHCFMVETILFLAVVRSVSKKYASAYGDDVLCESEAFEEVINRFKRLKFDINTRKTYNSSYFRESCGTDAFNGCSVWVYRHKKKSIESQLNKAQKLVTREWMNRATFRSVMNKTKERGYYEKINIDLRSVYAVLNGMRRSGCRNGVWFNEGCRAVWQEILSRVPKGLRFFGPDTLGDSVIHEDNQSLWTSKRFGWIRYIIGLSEFTKSFDVSQNTMPSRRIKSSFGVVESGSDARSVMQYALSGGSSRVSPRKGPNDEVMNQIRVFTIF